MCSPGKALYQLLQCLINTFSQADFLKNVPQYSYAQKFGRMLKKMTMDNGEPKGLQ